MKESTFRSRLVEEFKKSHPNDFIWAHDAHFKAGFPDVYVAIEGRGAHLELKVADHEPQDPSQLLSKIQLATIQKMVKAGLRVYEVVFVFHKGKTQSVVVHDFLAGYKVTKAPEVFWSEWRTFQIKAQES